MSFIKSALTLLTSLLSVLLAAFSAVDTSFPVHFIVRQSNLSGEDRKSSPTMPGIEPGDKDLLFGNRTAWNGIEWEDNAEVPTLHEQRTCVYCADILSLEFGFARGLQHQGALARLAIANLPKHSTPP